MLPGETSGPKGGGSDDPTPADRAWRVHFSRFAPVPEGELLGVESEFLMEDFGEVAEIGVPYAIHYLIDRKCSVLGKE